VIHIEASSFISFFLLLVAIFAYIVAREQLLANDSPRIVIKNHYYKISIGEDNYFKVKIENVGNGICLDAIYLIRTNHGFLKKRYYISKPTRIIKPHEDREVIVDIDSATNTDKVKRMFVFMDFFGRKYLAGDFVADVENSHLKSLSKKLKSYHGIKLIIGDIKDGLKWL
jgi:hypothetical protein